MFSKNMCPARRIHFLATVMLVWLSICSFGVVYGDKSDDFEDSGKSDENLTPVSRGLRKLCLPNIFINPYYLSPGVCLALESKNWSYSGITNGPRRWGCVGYPQCLGNKQSPINIDTRKLNRRSLSLNMQNYDKEITKALVENDGHTIFITPQDSVQRTIDVNGQTYTLEMFHFHWNDDIAFGSEHTINRKRFAFEAHFVHRNTMDEIAVVGVLYKAKRFYSNDAFTPIIDVLNEVTYRGQETELKSPLNLTQLLPEQKEFYRYEGSLTIPPCDESVVWSLFKEMPFIGTPQLQNFFRLYAVEESEVKNKRKCRLTENIRPQQPLNNREVILATP